MGIKPVSKLEALTKYIRKKGHGIVYNKVLNCIINNPEMNNSKISKLLKCNKGHVGVIRKKLKFMG